MRQFDLHEFLGYIVPGMLLLVGIHCIWPGAEKVLPVSGVSFGEFGVGVVLAYAVGQLLQGVGSITERCWWWFWGGMPTDWIRTGKHELIAPSQLAQVEPKVRRLPGGESFKLSATDRKQWYRITRQICAAVSDAGHDGQVNVFNGHYGLCRGLVSCLIVLVLLGVGSTCACWIAAHSCGPKTQPVRSLLGWGWPGLVVGAVLLVLAVQRMHHFGVLYGREVFVRFIQLPD